MWALILLTLPPLPLFPGLQVGSRNFLHLPGGQITLRRWRPLSFLPGGLRELADDSEGPRKAAECDHNAITLFWEGGETDSFNSEEQFRA